MKTIIAASIVIALTGNVMAAASDANFYIDGLKLKEWIDADAKNNGAYGGGLYGGYVAGVHDSLSGVVFCTPSTATMGQLKAVVAKFMSDNPIEWNRSADWLVVTALKKGFPCPK